jgi:hypothetical protein
MKILTLNSAVACLVMLAAPVAAHAARPEQKPAYLHAIQDLRHARANLERQHGDWDMKFDEKIAIHEIDAALKEIKEAAIDDGKDVNDHPVIDFHLEWGGRVRRALELLRSARKDVMEDRDEGFGRGLQKRAVMHIDEAIRATENGLR